MTIDLNDDVPVGTVVPWAGNQPDKAPPGWVPCDGRAVARTGEADASELEAAIGSSHGVVNGELLVPDLRGRFLRGVDQGAGNDPEASARTGVDGGATGDSVGSLQDWSTRLPSMSFVADISGLPPSNPADTFEGGGTQVANAVGPTITLPVTGGDRETRPANTYVHFLIKSRRNVDGKPVQMPSGGILGFAGIAGRPPGYGYVVCDGRAVRPEGIFSELGALLGDAFGRGPEEEGAATICLPELWGAFLRGVAGTSETDPDKESRGVARPDLPADRQGASGNAVGSRQRAATGNPPDAPFTAHLQLPTQGVDVTNFPGTAKAAWTTRRTRVQVATGGGDPETRPVNRSVTWHVRTGGRSDPTPPIGMVVAVAGEVPSATGASDRWIPCDGRLVSVSEFPDLSEVLGGRYDTDGEQFRVPDYKGKFLRGTSEGGEPGELQGDSTARPQNPFFAEVPSLPYDWWQSFGSGSEVSQWQTVGTASPFKDGGAETRPVNTYVNFIIRAR